MIQPEDDSVNSRHTLQLFLYNKYMLRSKDMKWFLYNQHNRMNHINI